MATDTWARYKLQRKLFAIGEDFWIENERGEQVFRVDGKALSIRHKFLLEDRNGTELLTVESKLLALQPTMTLERQGQRYATVTKALFRFCISHTRSRSKAGPLTTPRATSPTTSTRCKPTAPRSRRYRGSGSPFATHTASPSRQDKTNRFYLRPLCASTRSPNGSAKNITDGFRAS